MPKHNKEYVTNPESGRPILVGGETWRRMMNERVESTTAPEGGTDDIYIESKKKVSLKDKDARKNKRRFIRKRNNKTFLVKRTPKKEDIAGYVAKCASRTVHKHINTLSAQLDEAYSQNNSITDQALAEYEENVKNLILVEMLKEDNIYPANKNMNKTALQKNKHIRDEAVKNTLVKQNNDEFELAVEEKHGELETIEEQVEPQSESETEEEPEAEPESQPEAEPESDGETIEYI